MIERLILIGFSGTGKSAVSEEVAARLGWEVIDTDAEIQRTTGKSIPEIFELEGEPAFRRYERTELIRALGRDDVVIATGGGAVIVEDIWGREGVGGNGNLVVTLDASAETIHERLTRSQELHGDAVKRPLLDAANSLQKITEMKAARASAYARAHVTIPVDTRSVAETADDLADLVNLGNGIDSTIALELPGVSTHIQIGSGSRNLLADIVRDQWPKANRIWIAADENVSDQSHHAAMLLRETGFDVRTTSIPSGEGSKSIAGLTALYDWLLDGGVQRQDVLVALGGGVIGDLVGFAAATVLRGIGLVQVPTTLLAMVDSSIGGKTAINHATGKNLIGAFYQPSRVLIDPRMLTTLPARELASGWAEVIKHGEIQRSTPGGKTGHLRDVLILNHAALMRLETPLLSWVIRQNLTIKAAVVAEDERESGMRAILNYGHTLGHAIEASGYRYLHGEAIAVGMVGAVRLASEMDRIDSADIDRIEKTLTGFELPIRAEIDVQEVLRRIGSDKKKTSGRQQWVLANRGGGVDLETEVPATAIERAASSILDV